MSVDNTGLKIDVDQARQKLESGGAAALDVVQPGAWERIDGVIKGAIRIPPDEIPHRFEELPRDLDIITYCTGSDEATSARVALFLRKNGYRAWALTGGYRAWREAGLPLESKATEMKRQPDELCPECGFAWSDHDVRAEPHDRERGKE